MAINDRDFYASHGISFDVEEMQIEYTKRVIRQAKIEVLTELQLEIEELYPEHQCSGELTGFADAIETITPIIQQKINALKGENETC